MPDLYTNLILNDSRFKAGLADAESRAGKFSDTVRQLNGRFETLGKVARGAGAFALIRTGLELANGIMGRMNASVDEGASAWDRYRASVDPVLGALDDFAFGGAVEKLAFGLAGGADLERMVKANQEHEQLLRTLGRTWTVEREKLDVNKQIQRLYQEQEDTLARIAALAKQGVPNGQLEVLRNTSKEIFAAKYASITAAEKERREKEELDRRERAARAAGARDDAQRRINDQLFQDKVRLLRLAGKNPEADLLDLQRRTADRLRDLSNDTTSGLTPDLKRLVGRMILQGAAEEEALIRANATKKPADYSRSITLEGGGGGAAGLLGQVFAVGARAPFAKAEETLKAVEKNTAAEVRLLKSIDAGIKHVGVYR